MVKISVFGTGYVGLVTGVCFADMGHEVTCVDIDSSKVELLKSGKSPIYEPGLDEMLTTNIKASRLNFTTQAQEAVQNSEVVFIAVGTPPQEDGSADLQYVLKVAEDIATHMNDYKVIVTKSTVPVGTWKKVKTKVEEVLKKRGVNVEFDICSNPEFLREGSAIEDSLKPNRVVVGVETAKAGNIMREMYEPFLNGNPLLLMDPFSSEMTKYAANSMLAARISLMNEFSRVCEQVGADIEWVRRGIGADHRIGPHFLYAGVGYGGSCFPKDVRALIQTGDELGEDLKILKAVATTNNLQQNNFFKKVKAYFEGSLKGRKIAVWGAAFKPGTDDIREAPALTMIESILKEGGEVTCFDPVAAESAKKYFATHSPVKAEAAKHLHFIADQYDVMKEADALVIMTEWKSFREPVFNKMKENLKKPVIFDGRNIYAPKKMKERGFTYTSIGRN
ncbi:UDP-glucose/GDP-mannose dehydrogenase family protein [Bdellovibrio sp. NC01]|uniref:UDP-glucose dehydrogenase family protein n=1 Tax=Bdellovibrio sp. NC01 TaxID=2220073 RepID=UPI001AEF77E1|nr:UDP-glucose/GDP-mannose dehydrogenase family protein [Bdellovibrio sp. NC01]